MTAPARRDRPREATAFVLEMGHASDIIQESRTGGDSVDTSVAANQRMR